MKKKIQRFIQQKRNKMNAMISFNLLSIYLMFFEPLPNDC